jgi:hypothetical protein
MTQILWELNGALEWMMKHKIEVISTLLVVVISLIIFAPGGLSFKEIVYSLIMGASTLLMVFVLKYGIIWIVETIRALKDR